MKTIHRYGVATFACLSLVATATTASSLPSGCSATANMSNFGGDVDVNRREYVVYWGWNAWGVPSSEKADIEAELSNSALTSYGISGSKWWNLITLYYDHDRSSGDGPYYINNNVGELVEEYDDSHDLPDAGAEAGVTIPVNNVWAEADYLATNVLHPGADDIIVMMLPPRVTTNLGPYVCGQHAITPVGGNMGVVIPYGDGFHCALGMQQAVSHEIVESMADPNWNVSTCAWTQAVDGSCDNETCGIGDLCEGPIFTVQAQPSSSSQPDVVTQQYWSNEASGCVYARSSTAWVFGLGTDDKLWSQVVTDGYEGTGLVLYDWVSWGAPTGKTFAYNPGTTSWGPERVDAFVRDSSCNTCMYHAWTDDASGVTWENLPGSGLSGTQLFMYAPDAVSWGAGNVQVWTFTIDSSYAYRLAWKSFDAGGSWTGWTTWSLPSGVTPASKVSVASAMATNVSGTTFPTHLQTVLLSFIDSAGHLRLGNYDNSTGSVTWTSAITPQYGGTNISLTGDPDISSWSPGRADVFVMDTSGNYYDCTSNNGYGFGNSDVDAGSVPCSLWGAPSGTSFGESPGVAGLGDGRLLVVGRAGEWGGAGYEELWNMTSGSGWLGYTFDGNANGAFASGLDVASY